MGVNIPDRSDDSAAEFARQQADIARQVSEAKSRQMDKELAEMVNKGR